MNQLSTSLAVLNGAMEGVNGTVGQLTSGLSTLNTTVSGINGQLNGINTTLSLLGNEFTSLTHTLNSTNADLHSFNTTQQLLLLSEFNTLNATLSMTTTALNNVNTTLDDVVTRTAAISVSGNGSCMTVTISGNLQVLNTPPGAAAVTSNGCDNLLLGNGSNSVTSNIVFGMRQCRRRRWRHCERPQQHRHRRRSASCLAHATASLTTAAQCSAAAAMRSQRRLVSCCRASTIRSVRPTASS